MLKKYNEQKIYIFVKNCERVINHTLVARTSSYAKVSRAKDKPSCLTI